MKKDIESRNDVELLVNSFYDKVKRDKTIGYIFNDIAKVRWEHHLPVMYDFWESIIFNKTAYSGNPIIVHTKLNEKTPLNQQHFNQWLYLFTSTVDDLFAGRNAEVTKQRAASIAEVIQIKVSKGNYPLPK